jgi:uridine phosphorylase
LLAQELLEKPKMSNHARGLWGYSGKTASGLELTIQATGMGGPSAAIVLADLARLGVREAIRVGTCTGVTGLAELGELLLPSEAVAAVGSAASFGHAPGAALAPDRQLHRLLGDELAGEARAVQVASLDVLHGDPASAPVQVAAVDMQTVALFSRGPELGVAVAAILIVSKVENANLEDEALERTSVRAGKAAAKALSNLQVEG